MSNKSSHVPQETYHRIYWFAKRNVDARVIAHTLKLPLKTVENIVERLSVSKQPPAPERPAAAGHRTGSEAALQDEDFLDVFVFVKTRYTVLDISGMITKKNLHKLTVELKTLRGSEAKAVAISLVDVKELDADGLAAIVSLHDDLKKAGRFAAILDPSPQADAVILAHGADKKIPVFGTESAFESHAFR